ncbi:MAG: hypothetical protein ICV83_26985, partial [Cytophagales bacterium]|nr:hypothetical protein [Cytophagales bacterium]
MTKVIQQKRSAPALEDDEVDLISILVRLVQIVRTYALTIVLFTVIGLLAGVVLYLVQPRVYQSRMIANSTILQNPEVIAIVDSWQEYLNNNELEALSKALGLPVQTLRKVYLLEAKESKLNADGFTIYTKVGDTALLKEIDSEITKLERTRSAVENLLEAPGQRGTSMMLDLGNTGNINYQIMG